MKPLWGVLRMKLRSIFIRYRKANDERLKVQLCNAHKTLMSTILIQNPTIVNEGRSFIGDLLIKDEIIAAIGPPGQVKSPPGTKSVDASGLLLIPGVIDDHVHFREPGLTHKGDIFSETRAAAAGGITSFMDMPNTVPQTVTLGALDEKYRLGSEKSLINYSFYLGATDDNLEEIMKADPGEVCGIKLFMGSSTGNMLVDNENAVREIFRELGYAGCGALRG